MCMQDDSCKELLDRGKHMDDIFNLFLSQKKNVTINLWPEKI